MALNLLRNARVFISTDSAGTALTKSNTWELPILGDFSFSQGNETQDITVNEAGSAPTRGTARFNTQLNTVEWNCTSYMRPYKNTSGNARALDRIMWHGLLSDNSVPAGWNTAPWTSTTAYSQINPSDSNVHKFLSLTMYIKADTQWYKVSEVQVNQAEIDFAIDGIGQITWSGMGTILSEIAAPTFVTGATAVREYSSPVITSGGSVSATGSLADFIVQKYTTLYLLNQTNSNLYVVPITGGTLTINNNMTYLTPENLGVVNRPYAPISGTREITGSLSCYLKTGGTNDAGDLLNELLNSTTNSQNSYEMTFKAGGNSVPYVEINSLEAMLSIPTVDVQDVLSLNVDFKLMSSTLSTAAAPAALVQGTAYQIATTGTGNWTSIGAVQATAQTLTVGKRYIINAVGTSVDWASVGASPGAVDTIFTATGTTGGGTGGTVLEVYFTKNSTAGSGTGTAQSRTADLTATPNEFQVRYYPSTTTTDTNDTD